MACGLVPAAAELTSGRPVLRISCRLPALAVGKLITASPARVPRVGQRQRLDGRPGVWIPAARIGG